MAPDSKPSILLTRVVPIVAILLVALAGFLIFQNTRLSTQVQGLNDLNEKLDIEIKGLTEKAADFEKKAGALTDSLRVSRDEIITLRTQLAGADSKIAALQRAHLLSKRQADTYRETLTNMERRLRRFMTEMTIKLDTTKGGDELTAQFEDYLYTLQRDNKRLTSDLDSTRSALSAGHKANEELRGENTRLKGDLDTEINRPTYAARNFEVEVFKKGAWEKMDKNASPVIQSTHKYRFVFTVLNTKRENEAVTEVQSEFSAKVNGAAAELLPNDKRRNEYMVEFEAKQKVKTRLTVYWKDKLIGEFSK